jgi:hypothetical protein
LELVAVLRIPESDVQLCSFSRADISPGWKY